MKLYAPAVVDALGDALCLYWYKGDLRSFLTRAGVPPAVTAQLDWNENKRSIVRGPCQRKSKLDRSRHLRSSHARQEFMIRLLSDKRSVLMLMRMHLAPF